MSQIHCAELNNYIIETAQDLERQILDKVSDDLRKHNEAVSHKFDEIKKTLEVESKDTEELVEQMTFMDRCVLAPCALLLAPCDLSIVKLTSHLANRKCSFEQCTDD